MLVQLVDILNSGVARNFQWGVERRGAEGAEGGGVWEGVSPSTLGVGSGEATPP